MDIQQLQTELREYLFNVALNDLSIIRWTLVEERMNGEEATQYLDALLAYRDAEIASLNANKEYKSFIQKNPEMHWEQEEELYGIMSKYRTFANKAHQDLMDLILESDSYKQLLANPVELPDYAK
jgi:hypothetical protein